MTTNGLAIEIPYKTKSKKKLTDESKDDSKVKIKPLKPDSNKASKMLDLESIEKDCVNIELPAAIGIDGTDTKKEI